MWYDCMKKHMLGVIIFLNDSQHLEWLISNFCLEMPQIHQKSFAMPLKFIWFVKKIRDSII